MASITLSGGELSKMFPVGTSVGAYPRSARNPNGAGAPVGAAIASAAVAADNTWTISHANLVVGGLYTAYALVSGQHRTLDFSLARSDLAERRDREVGIRFVEATVDLTSMATNTTQTTDVAMPAGSCRPGDGVLIVQGDNTLAHDVYMQVDPQVQAPDVVRLKFTNKTAGTVNPAASNWLFAIIRA
jgi:hypothetical protein